MFQAPNGKVFFAGPDPANAYLDITYESGGQKGRWLELGNQGRYYLRGQGTAAMYAPGRILVIGGCDGSTVTNTTELITLDGRDNAAIVPGAAMRNARHYVNSTLLPDGTILVTGGSRVPSSRDRGQGVLEAELWNPPPPYGTGAAPGGTWTTLAAMREARMYHSPAALLPDGRVLSAGGEEVIKYDPFVPNQDNHCTAELFSPPYLFKGARPVISQAPAHVAYGQPFTLLTSASGSNVARITLVRLSSVTHSFNMNQRFLELPIASVGTGTAAGSVTIAAPQSAYDCPPGHYWLFVLNAQGVPSVGRVLTVGPSACSAGPQLTTTYTGTDTCSGVVTASVSGSGVNGNYAWTINGTRDPSYDGQATVQVDIDRYSPQVTFGVSTSTLCGDDRLENFASFTKTFPGGKCP